MCRKFKRILSSFNASFSKFESTEMYVLSNMNQNYVLCVGYYFYEFSNFSIIYNKFDSAGNGRDSLQESLGYAHMFLQKTVQLITECIACLYEFKV